jgi:hypothetical protein
MEGPREVQLSGMDILMAQSIAARNQCLDITMMEVARMVFIRAEVESGAITEYPVRGDEP